VFILSVGRFIHDAWAADLRYRSLVVGPSPPDAHLVAGSPDQVCAGTNTKAVYLPDIDTMNPIVLDTQSDVLAVRQREVPPTLSLCRPKYSSNSNFLRI
jgi:hypothetical protein